MEVYHLVLGTCIYLLAFTAQAYGTPDPPKVLHVDAAYAENLLSGNWSEKTTLLYLFSGDRVILLQDKVYRNDFPRAQFKIPADFEVTAAMASLTTRNYRFYGNKKYAYLFTYQPTFRMRKRKYNLKNKFLKNGGPDAIARRKTGYLFFKGCEMAMKMELNNGKFEWEKPTNLTERNIIPCNVDAAWKSESFVTILKGNKFWKIFDSGSLGGPFDTSQYFDFKGKFVLPSSAITAL